MSILIGAGGSKNIKEIYVGVGGAPRKVKEGYIGVGGAPKKFYSAGPSLPPKGTPLEECSWEQIRLIADAGLASGYFRAGDKKAVHLKGTAGKLALDATYYVYILGFDHNVANDAGAENSIDFGTFMDAEGKGICLVSGYSDRSDFRMNPTASNAGGWKDCDMRDTILGSGVSPMGPKQNTLMSCLPEDLRAVMKPMSVWTDNVGGGTDDASSVTATVDYLPLLAEFEVYGELSFSSNSGECSRLKQYEYYAGGGATAKYRHDKPTASLAWWERSPSNQDDSKFCRCSSASKLNPANYSMGLAPIFRV